MKSTEDLDDLLQRIYALPVQAQRECLLHFFSDVLAGMPASAVRELRAHLLRAFPPCPVQDLMIEVLDGQLALRELR